MSRIEGLLQKITGQSLQLRIDLVPSEAAAAQAEGGVGEAVTLPSRPRRLWAELPAEPLVRRAAELLGAQIIHCDDGFGTAPSRPQPELDSDDAEERRDDV
ncbi:MAG TPA: hypothetical protein VKD72_29245 [Gemmataceae bacterium]|nr:hypothetical protein [Gemmataceae bacterium]